MNDFIQCTEGKAASESSKVEIGAGATFKEMVGGSVQFAESKSSQLDQVAALRIIDDCMTIVQEELGQQDPDRAVAADVKQQVDDKLKVIDPTPAPTQPTSAPTVRPTAGPTHSAPKPTPTRSASSVLTGTWDFTLSDAQGVVFNNADQGNQMYRTNGGGDIEYFASAQNLQWSIPWLDLGNNSTYETCTHATGPTNTELHVPDAPIGRKYCADVPTDPTIVVYLVITDKSQLPGEVKVTVSFEKH